MIYLLDLITNTVLTFKDWRVAHYELSPCEGISEPCEARHLERYSDFYNHHNDFGELIGKACVLEMYLELDEKFEG